jgi:serine protease
MSCSIQNGLGLLLPLLLVGCGGGGSGGAPAAPANRLPTATFTADPISGGSPLTVEFDGSSSNDPDGTVASYSWNFGDGSAAATTAAVTHTYTAGSSGARYVARLTVRDDDGGVATKDAEIRVGPPRGDFTLSGTVQILPSSVIDSDVNDVATVAVRNDDFDSAQPAPNPATIGGYVTRAGSGPDGQLRAAGDLADFFRVNLSGTETLLLTVGEPDPDIANDDPTLSMQLYDGDRALVDSVLVTESGSLVASGSGDYFVEVAVTAGAGTYVLSIGQTVPASVSTRERAPRLSDAFAPGELIVVAPDVADLPPGYEARAGDTDLRLVDVSATLQERRALRRLAGPRSGGRLTARQAEKYETLAAALALSRHRGVRAAEPNFIRNAHRVPDDPYFRYQWHYGNVNLPLAWDLTQGSSDVIVAVVDTGILPAHPDIAGQLVPGYDFIRDTAISRDGNGIDNDPTDPGDLAYGSASSFHGTHVAGTVAAQSDDGDGVAGVAWRVRVMPVRALGRGGGTTYDVMQSMRWAAGLSNDSGTLPQRRADVINLSLGSSGSSTAEQSLVNSIRAAGVIVVASAGNDASSVPSYPAAYDGVVSVSATTIDKSLAWYSNFGATVDVAAPGGDNRTDRNGDGIADGVLSTIGDDSGAGVVFGYAALNGTSMSAPHVAGVVALMKSVHPQLTPDQFDTALALGELTEDLGAAGRDNAFGWGQIDAQRAVIRALELANAGGELTDPILAGSPNSVNFGPVETAIDVVLRNAGGGTLSIVATSTNAGWLEVAPLSVDANGLGTYRLTADRTQVPADGSYAAQVTFESDIPGGAPFVVSAVMQRFTVNPEANAGRQYIVVYHPATNTTINGVSRLPENGVYTFSIPNVGPGEYQIYAGTDSDNDNFLCDGGEACGAFRVLEFPETLTVDGSRSGIDFVSGFRANLFNTSAAAAATATTSARGVAIPAQISDSDQ